VAPNTRGRVSDPIAALSGSQPKAPGFAGGYLLSTVPSIGHITLYDGPGDRFGQRAKLVRDDFLYADTSRCSIWNDDECTDSYTHVYSVHRIDGALRDNLHGYTSGWSTPRTSGP